MSAVQHKSKQSVVAVHGPSPRKQTRKKKKRGLTSPLTDSECSGRFYGPGRPLTLEASSVEMNSSVNKLFKTNNTMEARLIMSSCPC